MSDSVIVPIAVVIAVLSLLKLVFHDPPSGYNMGTGDSIAFPLISLIVSLTVVVVALLWT